MTDLQASQSFANNAAHSDVVIDLSNRGTESGGQSRGDLSVSYDAASRSYTVTASGRTQSFSPADLKTSDPYELNYEKAAGVPGTDRLTVVKVPYTSETPTQFVQLGYWQRSNVADGRQSLALDIFAFGLPTSSATLPRTGVAGFSMDAFGLVTSPGSEPRTFDGRGTFSVDFARAVFSAEAGLSETGLVSGVTVTHPFYRFQASGRLSSGGESFAGSLYYRSQYGEASGTLDGRFYGPAAQEVGGAFSASNSNGMALAGAFTGRQESGVQPANLTLDNLLRPQDFELSFPFTPVRGQLQWKGADSFALVAPRGEDLNPGEFTAADKVVGGDDRFTTYRKTLTGPYGEQDATVRLYRSGAGNREVALTYASFGIWSVPSPAANPLATNRPSDRFFVYGFQTPISFLQTRTGTGRYEGVIYGAGSNPFSNVSYQVNGTSRFDVNFAAQSLSGEMIMTGKGLNGTADANFGSFLVSGTLFNPLQVTKNGQFSGFLDAAFFGPQGDELAGTFNVSAGPMTPDATTTLRGVTVAKRQ